MKKKEYTYKEIINMKNYYNYYENKKKNNIEKILNEILENEYYKRIYEINKNKDYLEILKDYRKYKKYNNIDYKYNFIIEYIINKYHYDKILH